jgi:multidrug transporter EmrE-like cation transporter
LKIFALTLAVVLANVAGNMALDWGSKHSSPDLLLKLVNPFVFLGIGLLILWTLLKITLLSHVDLSFYLPVTSVGYALNALAGWLFFAESISGRRWAGIALITAGAILAGQSQKSTTQRGQQ